MSTVLILPCWPPPQSFSTADQIKGFFPLVTNVTMERSGSKGADEGGNMNGVYGILEVKLTYYIELEGNIILILIDDS